MLRFESDDSKNKRNRAKHGIWFEEAQTAFDDPLARLFYEPEHSETEERFILLGISLLHGCWSWCTATALPAP